MNMSVNPCTDFFQYVCGGWIQEHPPPEDKETSSVLDHLTLKNLKVMKKLLEDNKTFHDGMRSTENKVRIYYKSCMDPNGTIEKLGPKPMQDLIKKIGGWNVSGDFNVSNWNFQKTMELMNDYQNKDNKKTLQGILILWAVSTDPLNSTQNTILLTPGRLGLLAKELYLNKSKDDEVISAYLAYMTDVGVLLGGEKNSTQTQMEKVFELEKKIANISLAKSEELDQKLMERLNVSVLQSTAPFLDWLQLFNFNFKKVDLEIDSSQGVMVNTTFIRDLSRVVSEYLNTSDGKM